MSPFMSSPSAALETVGAVAVKPLPPSFLLFFGRGEALQVLRYHSLSQTEKPGGCSSLEDKIRRKQGWWSSASGLSFLRVAMGTRSRLPN